ncbi:MAG TPA: hypothetical protein VFH70_05880 [Acidimicrobiales bacterium]|nr:hypothetical protein [Acidimicrobiales bacterium]
MTRTPAAAIVVRIVVAGLAGAIAGIHLDLWSGYGYRHIPTIGPLFLLNGISGAILAVASLTLPRRALPLGWLAVAGFAAATLGALLISLNTTLFGFHESTSAPLLAASIGVETAAIVVSTAGAGWRFTISGRRR